MTSQADFISQANITSQAYTRARLYSVVGNSMDMWCPYGIGREFWDRVMRMLVDPDPSPLKGEISLAGVFPFAGVGGSARIESLLLLDIIVS